MMSWLYMYDTRNLITASGVSCIGYVCVSPSIKSLLNAALKTGELEQAAALWTWMLVSLPFSRLVNDTRAKKCGGLFGLSVKFGF